MSRVAIVVGAIVLALILLGSAAVFVDETEYVLVVQFGEHRRTVAEPGLAFKLPLVQDAIRIDKRILARDTLPQEILTADKKRLLADPVTRWRVSDPLLFYRSVRDQDGATRTIDAVVQSELRQELARRTMSEMVGAARSGMLGNVTARTRSRLQEFGIGVVDVQIKRLDLPEEVQKSVFERMKAERERLAKGYRAQGQQRADEVTSRADREQRIILAEAKKKAEVIQGEGDAEAVRIYAEAFGADPEFYSFVRNLEAYEKSLGEDTTLVLSTGSELFRYLTTLGKGEAAPAKPAR